MPGKSPSYTSLQPIVTFPTHSVLATSIRSDTCTARAPTLEIAHKLGIDNTNPASWTEDVKVVRDNLAQKAQLEANTNLKP